MIYARDLEGLEGSNRAVGGIERERGEREGGERGRCERERGIGRES